MVKHIMLCPIYVAEVAECILKEAPKAHYMIINSQQAAIQLFYRIRL